MKNKMMSRNIRYLMFKAGIKTETELARLTGTPQPTVHRWLAGEAREPRHSKLLPIARYFNVTLDELLGKDLTIEQYAEKSETPFPLPRETAETQFYVSEHGYLVISQPQYSGRVFLTSAQLENLVRQVQENNITQAVREQEIKNSTVELVSVGAQ